jgi:hypothetical protein
MIDYLRRAGLILLLMAVLVLSIAYVKERKEPIVKLVPVSDLNYIPSPREIQQSLKDLDDPRYDPGKVDGIPGVITMEAWDNLVKDRYAKRAIEGE